MIYWVFLLVAVLVTTIIIKHYNTSASWRLPVLMYHKVSANTAADGLTISSLMLERQFHYLKQQGYTAILLSRLNAFVQHKQPLPDKAILITFDDGYLDNLANMYPLLKQYGLTANIFLIAASVNVQSTEARQFEEGYLSAAELALMDPELVEFGLHSYDHKNYNELSVEQLAEDIRQSKQTLSAAGVAFQPCLAFPYGAYPKNDGQHQAQFFSALADNGIQLAFRIGNRLNPLPVKNPLLLQRLDIKGNMPFEKFTKLLKNGKVLFS